MCRVAGAHADRLHTDLHALLAQVLDDRVEPSAHHLECLLRGGPAFVEGRRRTGDGVDGGAALHVSHVVGDAGGQALGQRVVVETLDQAAEALDRVGSAEVLVGMAALGAHADAPAARADCHRDALPQIEVEGREAVDARGGELEKGFGPEQVAEALLAHIGDHQHMAAVQGLWVVDEVLGGHEQAHEVGGVVADARCVDTVLVLMEGQRVGVVKDNVEVGGVDVEVGNAGVCLGLVFGGRREGAEHVVLGSHNDLFSPLGTQPVGHERGATLLVPRRGGNARELAQEVELLLVAGGGDMVQSGEPVRIHAFLQGLPQAIVGSGRRARRSERANSSKKTDTGPPGSRPKPRVPRCDRADGRRLRLRPRCARGVGPRSHGSRPYRRTSPPPHRLGTGRAWRRQGSCPRP